MYTQVFSEEILLLQDSQILTSIKRKYWGTTPECRSLKQNDYRYALQQSELSLQDVGGAFLFLASGITVAIIAGIVELVLSIKKSDLSVKEVLLDRFVRCVVRNQTAERLATAEVVDLSRPSTQMYSNPNIEVSWDQSQKNSRSARRLRFADGLNDDSSSSSSDSM